MMIFAIKVTKKCFLVDCNNKTAEVGSETVRIVLPGVVCPGSYQDQDLKHYFSRSGFADKKSERVDDFVSTTVVEFRKVVGVWGLE